MIILNREGTPIERYLDHSTDSSMQRFYMSHQSGRKRLYSLPICPKCEKAGLRDKGWGANKNMVCPGCGYHGPATYVMATYTQEKLYK